MNPDELATFMAATRRLESGSYEGNYIAQGRFLAKQQDRALGAYQIMSKNWKSWSSAAGIPGSNWRDPSAQDRVAAHMMNRYYAQFQNWQLVATAWYSGASRAQRVYDRYGSGATNAQIKATLGGAIADYAGKIAGYAGEAPESAWGERHGAASIVEEIPLQGPGELQPQEQPSPAANVDAGSILRNVLTFMAGHDRVAVEDIEEPEVQKLEGGDLGNTPTGITGQ